MIPIRIPWTSQPPAGTPIDWSNPITRGLVFAAPDANSNEIITGERPSLIHANNVFEPVNLAGHGSAMSSSSTSVTAGGRFWPDYYALPKIDGGDEITLWALQNKISGSITYPIAIDFQASASSPYRMGLGYSLNTRTGYISYDDDTWTQFISSGLISYPQAHTSAITFKRSDSPRIKSYVAAALVGTHAGEDKAVGWISETNSDTIGLNTSDQVNGATAAGDHVALGLVWNRALSPLELASLEERPWQVFQPRTVPIFFDTTILAAGTPTLDALIASGQVALIKKASGAVTLEALTASGVAALEGLFASGNPEIAQLLASGVAYRTDVKITDVNTTEEWNDGDTNLPITGTGFL